MLSLPMYPELMVEQIERVATAIRDFVQMDRGDDESEQLGSGDRTTGG